MHLDNKFKIFNIIFYSFIVFLLLYSFDYSFGWGLNLISPDVYFFTLGTGNNGYNPYVWNENGLIEFFQVLIIISSLIILINIIFKKNYSNLIKTLITIQFFGLCYILLEEISWGQFLIKFSTPDFFLNKDSFFYNKQGEFNLHNTSNIFNEIPRTLVLLWCTISIPIVRLIKFSNKDNLFLFIEPNKKLISLSILIFSISLPDLIINKLDLIDNSKLFIFSNTGFIGYDISQFILSTISFNFIRFAELQEFLIYNYFLWHSIFIRDKLINKSFYMN